MGLRIATNIQAIAAQRNLSLNNAALQQTLEKLASGSRINRAGDDAAGLAISERLRSQVRSMKQATRNAQDGISLIQVAEGSINEITNVLIRLRELSIQASSDTIGDVERGFIDKEVQNLREEIDRVSRNTEFNGVKLLDGSSPPLDIQIGINNNPMLDRFVFDAPNRNTTIAALGLEEMSTRSKDDARVNLERLDAALTRVSENRASLGALQNRLNSAINNSMIYQENLQAANSRIRDADMAEETSNLTKQNILNQSSVSVLGQANNVPALALKLLG